MKKILAAIAIAVSALVLGGAGTVLGAAPAHADCSYVPGVGWDC